MKNLLFRRSHYCYNTITKIVFIAISISFNFSLFAQITTFESKPELLFNAISNNLINPASYDTNDFISSSFSLQNRFGTFQKIRDLAAFGQFKTTNKSHLTLELYSAQKGPFIKKNRFYLGYNKTINITEKATISAGANLGYNNILLISNSAGNGGNAGAIDGNIGLRYFRKTIDLGIAYQQFVGSVLQPINYRFVQFPYYELYLQKTLLLNDNYLSFKTRLKFKTLKEYQSFFTIKYDYQDYFTIATAYSHGNFMSFSAGIKPLLYEKTKLEIYASYTIAFAKSIEQNLLEINILISLL